MRSLERTWRELSPQAARRPSWPPRCGARGGPAAAAAAAAVAELLSSAALQRQNRAVLVSSWLRR
jgi:hypothetical protein